MDLPSDLIDLLAAFDTAGVEYLQEFIRLKRLGGRPQDLVDADALAGSPSID